MEKIGTNLKMIRGENEPITITAKLKTDGSPIPFVVGDVVYFTVKESINEKNTVIRKEITTFIDGQAVSEILPEDTHNLECKKYIYDVRMKSASGKISTIIKKSDFTIESEVGDVR